MENNKTSVNDLIASDKDGDIVCNEHYNSLGISDSIVEKVTFAAIACSHNSFARHVGMPCELEITDITPYPAVTDEYGVRYKGFGGYRVPLTTLANGCYEVKFLGKGNGKRVVCGYIVDKQGRVESVATVCDKDGYATLPLTPDSHALYASVPTRRGKPLWGSITIVLMPRGMQQDVECYLSNVFMCVKEIARDVERLKWQNVQSERRLLN